MNINLLVTFADGSTKEVSAQAPDIVAFESKFDLSVARLESNIRITHLFYLAWHSLKRAGEKLEFEAWLETVANIEAQPVKK